MFLGFDFDRLRSGPFEGPAIVKPPALPGDTYLNGSVLQYNLSTSNPELTILSFPDKDFPFKNLE